MFVSNNSIVHLGKRRRYLRNNGTSFCWSRTIPDGKRVPTCDHISRPFVFWQFQWEMYLHSNSISSIQLDIILSIYIYIIPIDCWFFLPHHYTTFEAHVEATTPASKNRYNQKDPHLWARKVPVKHHLRQNVDLSLLKKWVFENAYLIISGWWFQSLWKLLVNWKDYSQYMEK